MWESMDANCNPTNSGVEYAFDKNLNMKMSNMDHLDNAFKHSSNDRKGNMNLVYFLQQLRVGVNVRHKSIFKLLFDYSTDVV